MKVLENDAEWQFVTLGDQVCLLHFVVNTVGLFRFILPLRVVQQYSNIYDMMI